MAIVTAPQPLPSHPLAAQGTEVPVEKSTVEPVTATDTPSVDPNADDEQLSPKFAILARKEKELRRQHQALQSEKAALKAKEEEYKTKFIPKDKLLEDPLTFLLENGVPYEKITEWALNQPGPQDQKLMRVEAELRSLKQAQMDAQTKAEQAQVTQYEQAVNQIRNDVKVLISSDENYDTIKQMNSEEAVVELIKETFEKDGTLLTIEDASKQVEEYLVGEALKMASIKKIKEKLALPTTPVEEPKKQLATAGKKPIEPAKQPPQPIKTLTNAQVASSSKPLTSRERRERAIAAFRGTLS